MAALKGCMRKSRKDGLYQIYIRVTHNTNPGYIKTKKVVTGKMCDKNGDITDPYVNKYCTR